MRSKLLLTLLVPVMCICFVSIVEADEINASVETSFMSKYMWHGFEMFGNKTATSLDLNVEFGQSGFYFGTEALVPNGSGNINVSDFDNYGRIDGSLTDRSKFIYYGGYMFTVLDTDIFKTDFDFRYQYHDYFKMSSDVLDQQEFSLFAQWTELIGGGFVPYYQATYLSDGKGGNSIYTATPSQIPFGPSVYGDDQNAHVNGWLHKVGLALDVPFEMPEVGMKHIRFIVESVFNDGAFGTSNAAFDAGTSMGAGSEWTHITYGAETDMNLGLGSLGIGVYYQHALADDYANLNNTFYSVLAYKLTF